MSLSAQAAAAADAALVELLAATERAELLAEEAGGTLNEAWASFVGSESTTSAVKSDAHSMRVLYDAMRAKRLRLETDDDARAFVAAIQPHLDVSQVEEVVRFNSLAGGVGTIAADTAKDAGAHLATIGEGWLTVMKAAPFLLVGFVLVVGWSRFKGARA